MAPPLKSSTYGTLYTTTHQYRYFVRGEQCLRVEIAIDLKRATESDALAVKDLRERRIRLLLETTIPRKATKAVPPRAAPAVVFRDTVSPKEAKAREVALAAEATAEKAACRKSRLADFCATASLEARERRADAVARTAELGGRFISGSFEFLRPRPPKARVLVDDAALADDVTIAATSPSPRSPFTATSEDFPSLSSVSAGPPSPKLKPSTPATGKPKTSI